MTAVRVIHRDRDLLVLDKPPGLPTTDPGDGRACLVSAARGLDPDAPRLHPSGRLDTPVSGVVVLARTARGTKALIAARREGVYRRRYLGVALAAPSPARGVWRWAVGRDQERAGSWRAVDPGDAAMRTAGGARDRPRPAETRYEVIAQVEVTGAVLLDLRPVTGRTHQLRVHAARAGCPLLGDPRYGGARRVTCADGVVVTAPRAMLHCAQVTLPGPAGGAPLRLRSPAPADLIGAWVGLGGTADQLDESVEGSDVANGAGSDDPAAEADVPGRRSSRAR